MKKLLLILAAGIVSVSAMAQSGPSHDGRRGFERDHGIVLVRNDHRRHKVWVPRHREHGHMVPGHYVWR